MIIGYIIFIIPKESITSSKKKLEEGFIELPLSREYKKLLKSKKCRPRIKIPENIRDKKIIQVEIIPINNGRMFKANFTYEAEKEPLDLDESNVMGIDLGCKIILQQLLQLKGRHILWTGEN